MILRVILFFNIKYLYDYFSFKNLRDFYRKIYDVKRFFKLKLEIEEYEVLFLEMIEEIESKDMLIGWK